MIENDPRAVTSPAFQKGLIRETTNYHAKHVYSEAIHASSENP